MDTRKHICTIINIHTYTYILLNSLFIHINIQEVVDKFIM